MFILAWSIFHYHVRNNLTNKSYANTGVEGVSGEVHWREANLQSSVPFTVYLETPEWLPVYPAISLRH
ncbi:uncharacterized protein N7529_005899 [Penicillium soppii]|uniref:uncharacterized protein n=1 Tax=Penicillium soppii TaxID=69789 RepID=UPI00254802B8|nr:uncharacterized protein N7529_005899 [Penicillium soppii]KAJ5863983.1 hypothetical protein N7529_005899 [Penicillium soppii]